MVILGPRIHFHELEDKEWCPAPIRQGIQSILHLFWEIHWPPITSQSAADHVGDIILGNLPNAGSYDYIDLCAGGGGPIPSIARRFNAQLALQGEDPARFVLTDLHPHTGAWERHSKKDENISYVTESVNAVNARRLARKGRKECRTFHMSFHHMDDEAAMSILRSTIQNADALVINELLARDISSFILTTLIGQFVAFTLPLIYLWHSPVHLLLTYLLPIIPPCLMFDGVVSCLRIRTTEEIQDLLDRMPDLDLSDWEIKSGSRMTFPPFGSLHWWMLVKRQG